MRLPWVVLLTAIAMFVPAGAAGEQAAEPRSSAAGQLDLGANFSCAIETGGEVRCWGYGAEGELGYPGVTEVGATNTPASAGTVDLGPGYTATAISSGDYHTCAIRNDGSVVCWGYGADGRLGYGNTNNVGMTQTPGAAGPVSLGGQKAVAISAGGGHTCAIVASGQVFCWGFGYDGQLGYGNRNNVGDLPADTPNLVGPVDLGAARTAVAITAGTIHTCAILKDGNVLCWGSGANGELGYGNTDNVGDGGTNSASVPDLSTAAAGPVNLGAGNTAMAISAGNGHTCATLDDGSVRCWGFGLDGQLGYGNTSNIGDGAPDASVASAGLVDLAGHKAVAITAGSIHTCAILDNGMVPCWGYGADGRLGYGNTNEVGAGPNATPGLIGPVNLGAGRTAVAISAGGRHTCARLDNGAVRCWGYGGNGRLGYCTERNVGDTPATTPDTAGPVNLVPGDGGELCPPAPPVPANITPPSISGQTVVGQTLTEEHGAWSPTPTGYAYQWERCDSKGASCSAIAGATGQTYTLGASDIGSTIRVLESASDGGAASIAATSSPTAIVKAVTVTNPDAVRERGFRRCLANVTARAKRARTLTSRASRRRRAQARRRRSRRLAGGRRHCVLVWGRTPGQVTDLRAIARGQTRIELEFSAPGTNARNPPGAVSYLIEQSLRPITSQRDFATAQALCQGACRFAVTRVGVKIILTVTSLRPHTTYYYAVAARDNVTARPGPRSRTVSARTA